ncbi:MAG: hypothetical protein KC713_05675 [Candidatus Omnitrophica bacterium]|nr:hypothetical protein [Candidatus Omnitrophota bacterium]
MPSKNNFLLPDIQNASLWSCYHGERNPLKNVWMTEIQACLYSSEQDVYILGHECRGENLNTPSQQVIRKDDYEFVHLLHYDGKVERSHIFRRGFFMGLNPFKPYRKTVREVENHGLDFKMRIPKGKSPITVLDSMEVYEQLVNGSLNIKDVYVWYELKKAPGLDRDYSLITPLKYINGGTPHSTTGQYLQPISGQVPFVYDGEVKLGYILCILHGHETKRIEFALSRANNLLDGIGIFSSVLDEQPNPKSTFKKLAAAFISLYCLPLRNLFFYHSYSHSIQIPGHCRFFRYKK